MIQTLNKAVIVVGDFQGDVNRWVDLVGNDYSTKSWSDLFPKLTKKELVTTNKLSGIIDRCEFVIRCSWMRTREPVGRLGRKLDAIQTHPVSLVDSVNKIAEREKVCNSQEKVVFDRKDDYQWYKWRSTKNKPSEVWLTPSNMYRKFKGFNKNWSKKEFEFTVQKCIEPIKYIQNLYSCNLKTLSFGNYLELWNELNSFHMNSSELFSLLESSEWGRDLIKKSRFDLEESKAVIDSQSNSFYINRGTVSMYMVLKDDRFKTYDKYFVGVHGIDQTFAHGHTHYDQFAEYRMITHWLKNGTFKYLPEHSDLLSSRIKNLRLYGN